MGRKVTISKVGEKHITNDGLNIEIIEYINWRDCSIKFDDGTIVKTNYGNVLKGGIKNPFNPIVEGKGFIGVGKYLSFSNGKKEKAYQCWHNMITRVHNLKRLSQFPTYIGCSIDESWYNYQNFAKWFEDNYIEGYFLDKDILFKNNKVYGPNKCCFVPNDINVLFTNRKNDRGNCLIGVRKTDKKFSARLWSNKKRVNLGRFDNELDAFNAYKKAKEAEIKTVAFLWKGEIIPKVYNAMINYKVKETD